MLPSKTIRADLRNKYNKYLNISLIIVLLLVIAAFKFFPKSETKIKVKPFVDDIIFVEPEINTLQKTEQPSLPKPVIPVIAVDDLTEDIIFEDISISEKQVVSLPPEKEKEVIIKEEYSFKAVEHKPEIIRGMEALQSKIYYPEIIRRAGIEGQVIVEFIVNKEGSVESAEVIKSANDQLDEIVMNAVKALKFKPGEQRGKPVKVKIKIPITFNLK